MSNAVASLNGKSKLNLLASADKPVLLNNSLPILYSFRRCPYAIRARMAVVYAGINIELREISLRHKPSSMLAISPKGTVPVLLLPDNRVIDESLAVMLWSLQQHDPDGWLDAAKLNSSNPYELIDKNDGEFKFFLDRYKYSVRFPEHPQEYYKDRAETFLRVLESRLEHSRYLVGNCVSLVDVAIFPFIRQFSKVDLPWFQNTSYEALKVWLSDFGQSELFLSVMKK